MSYTGHIIILQSCYCSTISLFLFSVINLQIAAVLHFSMLLAFLLILPFDLYLWSITTSRIISNRSCLFLTRLSVINSTNSPCLNTCQIHLYLFFIVPFQRVLSSDILSNTYLFITISIHLILSIFFIAAYTLCYFRCFRFIDK